MFSFLVFPNINVGPIFLAKEKKKWNLEHMQDCAGFRFHWIAFDFNKL